MRPVYSGVETQAGRDCLWASDLRPFDLGNGEVDETVGGQPTDPSERILNQRADTFHRARISSPDGTSRALHLFCT